MSRLRGVIAVIVTMTLLLVAGAISGTQAQTGTATPNTTGSTGKVRLDDPAGVPVGRAILSDTSDGMTVAFESHTFPNGDYELRFFAGNDCSSFSSMLAKANATPVAGLTDGTNCDVSKATSAAVAAQLPQVTIAKVTVHDLLGEPGAIMVISDLIEHNVVACGHVMMPYEGSPVPSPTM